MGAEADVERAKRLRSSARLPSCGVKSAAMPFRAIRNASELFWESVRERDPVLLVLADSDSCSHCRSLLAGPLREASKDLGM